MERPQRAFILDFAKSVFCAKLPFVATNTAHAAKVRKVAQLLFAV